MVLRTGFCLEAKIKPDGSSNPTLSHIFWGSSQKEAMGNAQAHLLTDFFFSSSFIGRMPWGQNILHLSNDGGLLSAYEDIAPGQVDQVFNQILQRAREVNARQQNAGIIQVIRTVAQ